MAHCSSWSEWLARLPVFSETAAAVAAVAGRTHVFSSKSVREERMLPHLNGKCFRARSLDNQEQEYDLRRLEPAGASSGFVTLSAFKALEREVALMTTARNHPNVVGCHAILVENVGRLHTRLLLCDPCVDSLAGILRLRDGSLSPLELVELGQQLALGVEHFHNNHILCGSISPASVLLGRDGLWKLGDFSCAVKLPITALQWREQSAVAQPSKLAQDFPEARSTDEVTIKESADVWLLGRLWATILTSSSAEGAIFEHRRGAGDTLLTVPRDMLLHVLQSRLWLLLHWMLAAEPTQRPKASEVHALLGTLEHVSPETFLSMMPTAARFHCSSSALAAVRKLAADQAVTAASAASQRRAQINHLTAGATLHKLRSMVDDPVDIDAICDNCGVELSMESPLSARYECEATAPDLTPSHCSSTSECLSSATGSEMLESPWGQRSACGHWIADDLSTSDDSDSGGRRHTSSIDSDGSMGLPDRELFTDSPVPELVDVGDVSVDSPSSHIVEIQNEEKKDK